MWVNKRDIIKIVRKFKNKRSTDINTSDMVIIKLVFYSVVIPLTYHKKWSFHPIYKVSKGPPILIKWGQVTYGELLTSNSSSSVFKNILKMICKAIRLSNW